MDALICILPILMSVGAGFVVGFLYGIDRANKLKDSQIRALEAEARECRQMALNFQEAMDARLKKTNL